MKQRWLIVADSEQVKQCVAMVHRAMPEHANRITVEQVLSKILETAMNAITDQPEQQSEFQLELRSDGLIVRKDVQ